MKSNTVDMGGGNTYSILSKRSQILKFVFLSGHLHVMSVCMSTNLKRMQPILHYNLNLTAFAILYTSIPKLKNIGEL